MHLNAQEIVDLIFRFKYAILFPIAFLEGPAVAVIAGFMIAINFMSFIPAYLILVSANIIGDIVYYSIGRLVPRKKLNGILHFFGITDIQIKEAEIMFFKNRKMAIIFGKIAHAVGTVFLVTAGIVKISFKEYLSLGAMIELPKALIFVGIGYLFGRSVANLGRTIDYSIIIFIIFTVLITWGYYSMGKYADKEIMKFSEKQK